MATRANELRFDGQVVVVTGGGRGLGRSYCRLLATRGAAVVVNDLPEDFSVADQVVAEIEAGGGRAVASSASVSTPDGAAEIVEVALSAFGQVDVLINNAGIMEPGKVGSIDAPLLQRHLDVHLGGSLHVTQAAWPHFMERGYGRIVFTISTAIFGFPRYVPYTVAKGAVFGLARSVAAAAAGTDIKVNLVAPYAITRMSSVQPSTPEELRNEERIRGDDQVAPFVAYLEHPACPVTGEAYSVGGGRMGRLVLGETKGAPSHAGQTVEDVHAAWADVNDLRDALIIPGSAKEWFSQSLRGDSAIPP